MNTKLRVGIIGATGMVGQRFVSILSEHPWFEVAVVAASSRSAGKTYEEAVADRWIFDTPISKKVANLIVKNALNVTEVGSQVDFVFCAVSMNKHEVSLLEEKYAQAEIPVISNNSAHRWTHDVPAIIPEINATHLEIIPHQKQRLGTEHGFIVVKPNCSIQSYVPAVHALMEFRPTELLACTYQAISGAGRTFKTWPDMVDNVIPYIAGEEEKSENEPLKIWGSIQGDRIVQAEQPAITTQCIRVPVLDGHLAATFVSFENQPSKDEIIDRWRKYKGKPQLHKLPSAPQPFIQYFEEADRPQTRLDRDFQKGMGVSIGRLREDKLFDYKFVSLSHNTLRGAAGGAVLIAELLMVEGYLKRR